MKIVIPMSIKQEEVVGFIKGVCHERGVGNETELQVGRGEWGIELQFPFTGPDENFWDNVSDIFLLSK